MTSKNPRCAKLDPLQYPVSLEGFKRIGRTSWIVTATGWQEWGYCQLIAANQHNEYRPHDSTHRDAGRPFCNRLDLNGEMLEARVVSLWLRPKEKVYIANEWQQLEPGQ